MARVRTAILCAAAATSMALLSGCSGYGYGFGNAPSTSNTAPAQAGTGAAAASGNTGTQQQQPPQQRQQQPTGPVGLIARQLGQLGVVVTDAKGWTLYRYDRDTAAPPLSNCAGPCAVKWPPVLANPNGQVKVNGVDANLVDSVTRQDGLKQVTINGWPVYRFSGDTAPGEARGEGIVKLWYAITPLGKKAGAAGAATGTGAGTGATGGGADN
jgi:predicted lipoprotein with Yx(FWY)xxD motif